MGFLGTRMDKVNAVCGETEHQYQYNSFVKTITTRGLHGGQVKAHHW